ncbi:MAG: hypothetical protein EOO62_10225 [Hymenobacter sp.]|nr:MAG: hypothetical protein EOO62_10225 [Hymenobacter sp.]
MRYSLLLGGLLLAGSAWAQQPALPGAPQPATTPTAGTVAPVPIVGVDPVLGGRYEVTLQSGSVFTGTLTSLSLDALEFDTQELGHLRVLRTDVKQVRALATGAARTTGLRPSYYDIGNGNRLFFGPTARNLRQGEGVLQDAYVWLVGVNYGITDNISMGGYLSIVPGVDPGNQFIMLTPKVSVPLRENLHAGAGALYIRVPDFDNGNGTGVGLLYGALTWGSADNNLTAGIGYGFAGNGIGSTPTLMLGGQRRVSRRISLVSENYFIANSEAGAGGLYGLKINWKRTNLGLAALYLLSYQRTGVNDSQFFTSYIIPLYVDFSFRFGKPYQRPKQ